MCGCAWCLLTDWCPIQVVFTRSDARISPTILTRIKQLLKVDEWMDGWMDSITNLYHTCQDFTEKRHFDKQKTFGIKPRKPTPGIVHYYSSKVSDMWSSKEERKITTTKKKKTDNFSLK